MNNYCSYCGDPLAEGNFCPNCGKPIAYQKNVDNTDQYEPSEHIQTNVNNYQIDNKGSAAGKSFFIFLIIILCGILFSIIYVNFSSDNKKTFKSEFTTPSTSMESDDDLEYITLAEYNSIKNGMTYDEVVKLIGSEGTSISESSVGNVSITIISWYGNGFNGSNANVTFTNNKVTGKAQIGLE